MKSWAHSKCSINILIAPTPLSYLIHQPPRLDSWGKFPRLCLKISNDGKLTPWAKSALPFGQLSWSECYFANNKVNQNQPGSNVSLVLIWSCTPSEMRHKKRSNMFSSSCNNRSCHHLYLIHSSITSSIYSSHGGRTQRH